MRVIPGTTMKYTQQSRNEAFSVISPILEATGGLTLSQLSKLTGIESSTIQNWIKRGWVIATKSKKYTERQILRILLINMFRGVMKLEDIANLMVYVNGDVEDTSDDIIDEILLYNVLCKIIFNAEDSGAFDKESIQKLINSEIKATKNNEENNEKLRKSMLIMILAYRSSYLKTQMETEFKTIFS